VLQSPPPSPCWAASLTRLTSPLYLLLVPVTRLAAVTRLMARDGDSHADLDKHWEYSSLVSALLRQVTRSESLTSRPLLDTLCPCLARPSCLTYEPKIAAMTTFTRTTMMSVGTLMLMLLLPSTVVSKILDRLLYTGILELKDSSIRLGGRKMELAECIVTVTSITVR